MAKVCALTRPHSSGRLLLFCTALLAACRAASARADRASVLVDLASFLEPPWALASFPSMLSQALSMAR